VTPVGIKTCLNIIIKKIWIVVTIPLLVAVVTAVINLYILVPVYESSVTFYVINKDSDSRIKMGYDDILASQQLIKDFRELIKSRSNTKAVIERLNLADLTEEELAKKITVNLKNDTRLFEIKVRDTSNLRAKEIADEVGSVFQKRVNDLIKLETLDVVDEAEVPLKPVSPKPLVNIFIAFATTLFLVASAVFLMEYLDDTLKNLEDVEKLLGIKVIGIIPDLDMK
jgi:capsular polysaccharide biosynthesis protein